MSGGRRNQVLSRGNTKLEGKKVLFRRKKEKVRREETKSAGRKVPNLRDGR